MRTATRMMMISALGERMGEQPQRREHQPQYPEHEMRMYEQPHQPEMRRYAQRHDTGYESDGRYARRYAANNARDMPESRYEAHWDDDPEMATENRRRRMQREMRRYGSEGQEGVQNRSGMYSGGDNPMGFSSHRKRRYDEQGEEELSGSFRYRQAPRDVQEDLQEEQPLNEMQVKKWLKEMQNEDGTTGGHFGRDSAEALRRAHCPGCDELEFYAAINMIYSDSCKVARQMSVDRPEFYAHMAKAFLEDKDAGDGKLLKYMRHVVGKK